MNYERTYYEVTDEFVKDIYNNVVEENLSIIKDIYNKANEKDITDEYYKKAIEFYNSLQKEQKELFFEVIKQTSIDTISSILGIFDKSTEMEKKYEIELKINNENMEYELQDKFLEYVEDNNAKF